jgi:hypothetical protein
MCIFQLYLIYQSITLCSIFGTNIAVSESKIIDKTKMEMNVEIKNTVSAGIISIGHPQTKSNTAKSSFESSETNQIEPESIWRKMASKYDVRSITIEETANLSQELYNAGEISLRDHAILSFDPDRIPHGTGFLTQADSTGHRDLISEYETRIDMDKKMGNSLNLVNNERVLEYLERLDAAKGNPIHITA